MKLLGIDCATERCSVALDIDGQMLDESVVAERGHGDMVLPMVQRLLQQASLSLRQLDGIAYGRGPGGFTGVRMTVGVVQGLAYGAGLSTVGVSNLAAVAQQVAQPGRTILVCMDARMGEIYWARFRCDASTALVTPLSDERVSKPEEILADGSDQICVGTGLRAHPSLLERLRLESPSRQFDDSLLPRSRDIITLASPHFIYGRSVPAGEAAPVYIRDKVTYNR